MDRPAERAQVRPDRVDRSEGRPQRTTDRAGTDESIAILTPSFNYARYLPTAIESVALQDDPGARLYVNDGMSDDGTAEVLDAAPPFVDARVEPDRGQSDALNKAFDRTTESVIGWLNADDFYLPGAFAAVRDYFRDNPGIDVVYGDTLLVDDGGALLRSFDLYRVPPVVLRRRGCVIMSTSTFFRRRALEGLRWEVEDKLGMDWNLYLSMIDRGVRFGYLPKPLAAFRVHDDQVSHGTVPRSYPELRRIRQQHGIAFGDSALSLGVGNTTHRVLKVLSGSWAREQRDRPLHGTRLLTESGAIAVPEVTDLMRRLA